MKRMLPLLVIGILVLSGLGAVALQRVDSTQNKETFDTFGYDLVIITPKEFTSVVQKLVDHKNQHNVDTYLKTTQDIYEEYSGRDTAEQIKYFIKDAIESTVVEYVLLFGGMKGQSLNWHIPVRYILLDDDTDRYDTFMSDLYFADIYKENGDFEDWDSNGDGVFAEWGKDTLDLHPDVSIGRLPCRNSLEAWIVVNKIINYENTAYGKQWFNNMIAVGGDSFPEYPGNEGEDTCEVAISYMGGFNINRLYTSTGALTSINDLVSDISQGCGFVITRGRGGQDRLRMVNSDGTEVIALDNQNIHKLRNKNMYPVVVLGECIHGKFDVSIFNIFKLFLQQPNYYDQDCIFECIAWRLVNKYNGGAIAVLTNTNICYGDSGDKNQNGIPDDAEKFGGLLAVDIFRLYGEEGMKTLGDIHTQTIEDYMSNFQVQTNKYHCKSIQEWILIGDPSLKIGGYEK
jgi:hypothetical protein